jgi:hypothetical protein
VPETRGDPGAHTPHTAHTPKRLPESPSPGTPLSSGRRKNMLRRAVLTELPLWLSVLTLFALAVIF